MAMRGLPSNVIHDDENTDVNAKDSDGMTALQHAIIKGYPKLLDKLLAREDIEVNSHRRWWSDGVASCGLAKK